MKLPLVHFFETSFGRIDDKHFILVRARRRRRRPATASASRSRIRTTAPKRTRPRGTSSRTSSRRACSASSSRIRARCSRRSKAIRGHNMAKAAVEMAAWDLFAQAARRAAQRGVARRRGATASRRACRSASSDSLDELAAKVERELAAGYRRIKIKIKPGWDLDAGRDRARALRRDPADGGRERGLHARRRGAPRAARSRSI